MKNLFYREVGLVTIKRIPIQTLAAFNPWIAQPKAYKIHTGSLNSILVLKVQAVVTLLTMPGWRNQSYKNMALFLNDIADGKTLPRFTSLV